MLACCSPRDPLDGTRRERLPSFLAKRLTVSLAGLALACGQPPKGPRLSVVAGSEYAGAEVLIDGEPRGTLSEESLRDRLLFALFAQDKYQDVDLVELEIPASSSDFEAGVHQGEISKPGFAIQAFQFVYPFRRLSEYAPRDPVCSAVLARKQFIVGPECSVRPWKMYDEMSRSKRSDLLFAPPRSHRKLGPLGRLFSLRSPPPCPIAHAVRRAVACRPTIRPSEPQSFALLPLSS